MLNHMSNDQISINNLSKVYDNGFEALKKINLNIKKGEIFAMLGPNGAGKTTLISIICGIVRLSRGKLNAPTGIDGMVNVIKRVQELEDKFALTKNQYSKEAKRIRRRSEKSPSVGVVFGKNVLEQLLFLQNELISSENKNPVDPFLISIILHSMHGDSDSYFSVSMPNTFSYSPKYIKK